MNANPTLKRKPNQNGNPNGNSNGKPNEKHPKSSKQVAFGPNVPHIIEWSTYPTPAKGTIPPYPRNTRRIGKHIGPNVPVNQTNSNKSARFALLYAADDGTSKARLKELVEQPYEVYYDNFIKKSITSKELYNKMKEAEEYLLQKYPLKNVSTPIYFDKLADDYNTDIERNKIYTMIIRHYDKYIRLGGGRRTTRKRKQRKH